MKKPRLTLSTLKRLVVSTLVITALMVVSVGCGKRTSSAPTVRTVALAKSQKSGTCRECHEVQFAAWQSTDHALANRVVNPATDAEILSKLPPEGKVPGMADPDLILGNLPIWQPLIPSSDGRWQVDELAYDPAKKEWFNVFGNEQRRVGEWGHWTGRGMNWNSMCAHCHMTGYEKNYDTATDTYRTTWVEHGVGCIQCHGPMPADHNFKNTVHEKTPPPFRGDRGLMQQTCAPCHALNELLTADFQPGDNYNDHYRIMLPTSPTVFYADGQVRDEDYNWTSLQLSRMGHAGVTCLDCHDPHSTKTILPASDNQVCLQCHAAPGRDMPSGVKAIAIDPVAHSHHKDGTPENQCVACHMPVTTYMQRSPRHDHGWTKPDPLLTKELGIPNACSRCHADKPIEWLIDSSQEWYGEKLDSRQRARARAVAAAYELKPEAAASLLALLKVEDVPAWRATLLTLAGPYASYVPEIAALATTSLTAKDPLERSAAVRVLGSLPETRETLKPLLNDPTRLVRLDAEWALSTELAPGSKERKELDAYLALTADQPAGRLRIGQDWANRGDLTKAEAEIKRAIEWDPYSAGIYDAQGLVLNAAGKTAEAADAFLRAAKLTPTDASSAYRAALAYAEAKMWTKAEEAFRMTVERNPKFDRAWYNLGLLLAQLDRLQEAAEALRTAEQIAPQQADYSYALATVLYRAGDQAEAVAAARRALESDPRHAGAARFLRQR